MAMWRLIIKALCVVSVVLSLLVLIIWIRSYFRTNYGIFHIPGSGNKSFMSTDRFGQVGKDIFVQKGRVEVVDAVLIPNAPTLGRRLIFSAWIFPIFAALLLLPGWELLSWFRIRPQKPGFCQKCGYDLRATPDRCPECGTIPQKTI